MDHQQRQRAEAAKTYFRVGFHAMLGAMTAIGFVAGSVQVIELAFGSMDNSDKSFWHRSGMSVKTDALTGCQYLEGRSLTPRINDDGKQICVQP